MKTIETHSVTFLSCNILASAGVEKDDCVVHTRIIQHVKGKIYIEHVNNIVKVFTLFHKTVTVLIW